MRTVVSGGWMMIENGGTEHQKWMTGWNIPANSEQTLTGER